MFTIVQYDKSKLESATASLASGSDISVLEHNSVCVMLGVVSDLSVDPTATYHDGNIALPRVRIAGTEYSAVGLRCEPSAWWRPDAITGIDAMRRMAFRASQQLLRTLQGGRPVVGTSPAGNLQWPATGPMATYGRVAEAVFAGPTTGSDVVRYPAEMPKNAVAAALAYLAYAADYIGEAVSENTSPIVQPTPMLREGERYAQALAEAYRRDMSRNYWLNIGAMTLAVSAAIIAAYRTDSKALPETKASEGDKKREELEADAIGELAASV